MLSHKVDETSGIVELVIDGEVSRAEYDAAINAIDGMIERHGTVKVLEILKNLGWVDMSVWWKDTVWGLAHLRDFGRVAVVTDKGWVGPFAKAIGALMPSEEVGRAHVGTPVTNATLVCPILLEKHKHAKKTHT